MGFRVAVLTVSDGVAAGTRRDLSGEAVVELAAQAGGELVGRAVVADDRPAIAAEIARLSALADVVLTTGGTGLGPRDVTPEATRDAVEREAPGIAELMRIEGLKATPLAALSRATAGVRGRCLVVNLPGSPGGVRESLAPLLPLLPHAAHILAGGGH
jgi:molybdopterin adenylyltransferase